MQLLRLLALLALFTTSARADGPPSKKAGSTKTATCEKTKQFLADLAAKGRCVEESAAAQQITCSPETFKQVTDLNTRCAKAPPRCRALIDGTAIAEVEDPTSATCAQKLEAKVRETRCTPAMKGKQVAYTVRHLGKAPIEDRATSLTCAN